MYSLVLMAALSGGASQPATFWHGCHGGNGCVGGCAGWGGCNGCYGGCAGWGAGGCYGGGFWGCGCGGGCYGNGYNYWTARAPFYTNYANGCHGCYGGPVSAYYAQPRAMAQPSYIIQRQIRQERITTPPKEVKKNGEKESVAPSPARLVVEVPADAKLYLDDHLTKATDKPSRSLMTPALEPGQDYYYILRAEVMRDGQPFIETQRVVVRAGDELRISLRNFAADTRPTAVGRR